MAVHQKLRGSLREIVSVGLTQQDRQRYQQFSYEEEFICKQGKVLCELAELTVHRQKPVALTEGRGKDGQGR